MGLLPPSAEKYDFEGIGSASAAGIIALLAANPYTSFLTVGLSGKILYWVLKKFFVALASMGLVLLNVGAEQIATAIDKSGFDGSLDNAYKIIDQLQASGHGLTPEQIKAIDDPVIAQFQRFAKLTRGKGK